MFEAAEEPVPKIHADRRDSSGGRGTAPIGGDDELGLRQGNAMLMTHFIGQTDLKPSSVFEWPERSNHPFSHSYNAGKV